MDTQNGHLKGQFTQKYKFCHHLLILSSFQILPLFHQSSSSAGSVPSFNPILCLLTPKAPAPNQEKQFVSSTKTLLGQKEEQLVSGAGGGATVANKKNINFELPYLK